MGRRLFSVEGLRSGEFDDDDDADERVVLRLEHIVFFLAGSCHTYFLMKNRPILFSSLFRFPMENNENQLRRLSDTERQQGSLRQKNKQVLCRNVELSTKSQELADTVKTLQQVLPANGVVVVSSNNNSNSNSMSTSDTNLKRSLTRPNVHHLSKVRYVDRN